MLLSGYFWVLETEPPWSVVRRRESKRKKENKEKERKQEKKKIKQ